MDSQARLFWPSIRGLGPDFDRVDINPGNRAHVPLYFDIPKDTRPSQLREMNAMSASTKIIPTNASNRTPSR